MTDDTTTVAVAGPSRGDATKVPLREVRVSEQVIHSCLRHAFTTENEEVVGMLLGRFETQHFPPTALGSSSNGVAATNNKAHVGQVGSDVGCIPSSGHGASSPTSLSPPADVVEGKVAYIWATHVSERSVQCSDRVETSPESLASAAEAAERVSDATGVATTVVGWYHSHPKIPVVPSAVDLRTQREHQLHLESGWVGLIVSVFNAEAGLNRGHCALHCFQAGPCNEHIDIPVHVVPDSALFSSVEPLEALRDSTPDLLRVLQREILNGVQSVNVKTCQNAAATRAARGLADMQLYEVNGLVAEPTRTGLQWFSLPLLRAEVARLEKKLAATSATASSMPTTMQP